MYPLYWFKCRTISKKQYGRATIPVDSARRLPKAKCATMIKFIHFQVYRIEFQERLKTPFTVSKYLHAFFPEIFKFEKCAKYANERTDEVILSTKYNIKYINKPMFG